MAKLCNECKAWFICRSIGNPGVYTDKYNSLCGKIQAGDDLMKHILELQRLSNSITRYG